MTSMVWADIARDVIEVRGADVGAFLHSQLANDIDDLSVGASVHSLLLEPTGHVVALVRVARHEQDLWTIDVERGHGEAVIARLRRFILRADVTMVISGWVVRAYRGAPIDASMIGDVVLFPAHGDRDSGVDAIGPVAALPILGEPTEAEHIDFWRVEARWPRLGVDILVGDIPATTGIVPATVSFTKGCYPGQELVERMDSRSATAPVVVKVLPREPVPIGSRCQEDGLDVGTVTSIGFTVMLARVSRQSTLGQPLMQ